MKRRLFLAVVCAAFAAWPLLASAEDAPSAQTKTLTATNGTADSAIGAAGIQETEVQKADAKDNKSPVKKVNMHGVVTYWGNEDLEEVVKGFYLDSRIGYLGLLSGDLKKDTKGGFTFGFGLGGDLHPKYVSLEADVLVTYAQTDVLNNDRQVKKDSVVKGDFMALRVPVVVNVKYFTTKRLELSISPLGGLFYNAASIKKLALDGGPLKADKKLDFYGGGRLGIEYYTGLRHFSIGIEVEGDYIIGAKAMALSGGPLLKYTF